MEQNIDDIELKAKELMERFYANPHRQESSAKECAIICCDEILAFISKDTTFEGIVGSGKLKDYQFYLELKEKIKSL